MSPPSNAKLFESVEFSMLSFEFYSEREATPPVKAAFCLRSELDIETSAFMSCLMTPPLAIVNNFSSLDSSILITALSFTYMKLFVFP